MKIAIISDIHGNIFGLDAVLKDMGKVDQILCAGDISDFYPFVNEVIDRIKEIKIVTIKGNHDKYLIENKIPEDKSDKIRQSFKFMKKFVNKESLDFLTSLPDNLHLMIDGKKVLVFHGSPWDYFEERVYPDYSNFDKFKKINADVVILGHTHYPIIKNIGSLTLINPGSCGQPRDYNLLSYVIWDTRENRFENIRLKWDVDEFIHKVQEMGVDKKLFEVFERIKVSDKMK